MREVRPVPNTSVPMWVPMTTMTGVVAAVLAIIVYFIMATNSASTISTSQISLRNVVVDAAITKVTNLVYTAESMLELASYTPVMVDYYTKIIANGRNSTRVYANMIDSPVGAFLWSLSFVHKDVVGLGILTYNLNIFIGQNRSMIFHQDNTTDMIFTGYPRVRFDPNTFAPTIVSNATYPVLRRSFNPYIQFPVLNTCTGYGSWTTPTYGTAFGQFLVTLYWPVWNTRINDCTGSTTNPPVFSYLTILTTGALQSFLTSIFVTDNTVISIWEGSGSLISSNIPGPVEDWSKPNIFGAPALYNVTTHPNPLISASAALLLKNFGRLSAIPASVHIEDSVNGTAYIVDAKRIEDKHKLAWMLVVTTPRSDVWGEIESGRDKTIGVIAGVAAAMVILGVLFAFMLTIPLRALVKVMDEVANFKFEALQGDKIQHRSKLRELASMQVAFHKMVVKFAEAIQANKRLVTASGAGSQNRSSIGPQASGAKTAT